jgi:hypothetical protein
LFRNRKWRGNRRSEWLVDFLKLKPTKPKHYF